MTKSYIKKVTFKLFLEGVEVSVDCHSVAIKDLYF